MTEVKLCAREGCGTEFPIGGRIPRHKRWCSQGCANLGRVNVPCRDCGELLRWAKTPVSRGVKLSLVGSDGKPHRCGETVCRWCGEGGLHWAEGPGGKSRLFESQGGVMHECSLHPRWRLR
jgi:hypothetical protein